MNNPLKEPLISSALQQTTEKQFGVVDAQFLCRSVGTLQPKDPVIVNAADSVDKVMKLLQKNKIGCVLVVDETNKLVGIFSERDYVLKVYDMGADYKTTAISSFMTLDPVTEQMDTSLAFVLNLMSLGGFRHLPIVDLEHKPVAIISIKDIVDAMVKSMVDDLMSFEEEE